MSAKHQRLNLTTPGLTLFKTFNGSERVEDSKLVEGPAPFKKVRAGSRWLVLDFEGFTATFAGAESEVGSESLVGLFD